jgi:hypothetical protein
MIEHGPVDVTVDEMERALATLVTEIVSLYSKRRGSDAPGQAPSERAGPAVTKFKGAIDLIISSPIDGALRLSVRQIGERLFCNLQSPLKMMHVARRVCSDDEANWSRRMTAIDSAWEGIGSKAAGFW